MFLPLYCVFFCYGFWLPFQAFLVFMFLPLYCVSFGLRLLITPWSFTCLYVLAIALCVLRFTASDYPFKLFLSLCSCHCIVCPSVYGFWLPLQAFLVFMFLPLYCVSFGLRLLVTPLSFSCLYVLVIVLCVLRFTASDYPFNLFLSLCSSHCILCPSVYGFWLPLEAFLVFMFLPLYCVSFGLRLLIIPSSFSCLYVLPIVYCVLLFTASDYPFKLFLSLCSSHCIVCPSVYGFWLPLQAFLCLYVLAIVLCVLRCTASDYPFKLFLSLCSYHCIVCPSVYGFWLPLKLFLSLCSFHCIVCPSLYGFWLHLQAFLVFMFLPLYCVSFGLRLLIIPSSFSCLYVLAIVLCVLRFTASDYPLKLFLSLCSCHCIVCPSVYASDYPFKLFLSLCSCHCIVCPSVYGFWLPLQTFLVFMFLPLYCVSFGLRLLIIPSNFSLLLCSCHCIVCPSVYGFWLSLQSFPCLYVLAIVLCVLRFTASDYPFKLFLSLCSCHCIVCPSVYGFWLPLQAFLVFMFLPLYCVSFGLRLLITPSNFSCLYVLAIVLCVLRFTASDYPFKLFLSLCSCNCIVCSSVYGFWLPLQAFLVFMFLPLYCVSFDLRLLIT